MLNVVMLNVVMLSAVAPRHYQRGRNSKGELTLLKIQNLISLPVINTLAYLS